MPLLKINSFHSEIHSSVLLSKINSFHSEICPSVLLSKISSFHSEICPSVLLSKISSFHTEIFLVCTLPNINSFLFGVCSSVLRQISTPSFFVFACLYFAKYQLLPFWLRLRAAPLYLCAIITYSICHIIGLGCTRPKGAGIYLTITLIGPSVLCWRKGEKQVPQ